MTRASITPVLVIIASVCSYGLGIRHAPVADLDEQVQQDTLGDCHDAERALIAELLRECAEKYPHSDDERQEAKNQKSKGELFSDKWHKFRDTALNYKPFVDEVDEHMLNNTEAELADRLEGIQ